MFDLGLFDLGFEDLGFTIYDLRLFDLGFSPTSKPGRRHFTSTAIHRGVYGLTIKASP
jgi:hypothetical protein